MIAVDASLLARALNRYPPEHVRAAEALEALVNGDAPWALPAPAIPAFLDAVGHTHRVARPLGRDEALGFLDALLAAPGAHLVTAGAGHLAALREAAASAPEGLGASRLAVAAVLREHGIRELLSTDRHMRRFAFLTVIDPVHGPPWSPDERPVRRYRVLGARGRR